MVSPYKPDTPPLLSGPLGVVVAARVVTTAGVLVTDLDVRDGALTFDAGWSPYVQGTVVAVTPTVGIDPRLGHRVQVDLGYVRPDGTRDVQRAADLTITAADRDYRAARTTLTVQSDEALVQESAQSDPVDLVTTFATIEEQLRHLVERALRPHVPGWIVTWSPPLPSGSTLLTAHTVPIGARWWSFIETLRDVAGAEVWCDEARVWHMAYSGDEDVDASDPLTIATGAAPLDGTAFTGDVGAGTPGVSRSITELVDRRDRGEWANAVVVDHTWTSESGVAQRVAQHALTMTGPHAVDTIGYRVTKIDRDTPIDQNAAAAEAAAILRRTMARGVQYTVTARAAYWLRPRRSIRLHFDGATTYRWLTRVEFPLDGSGLMTLTTRAPVGSV